MTEFKLAFRNLKRDFKIYILLIISSSIFLSLIIGFQSTITSGDLGAMLSQGNLSANKSFFNIILWGIACGQYLLLLFFFNSYYRFINKIRVRELALYKVIGYSRFNIFKIILMEGICIYIVVSLLAIIIAFLVNGIIIEFINYYLALSTKLSASLDIHIIIVTLLLFLMLVFINVLRTYYKAVKVDVDQALNEAAIQKKISTCPKYYIVCMFILGMILLVNMTFLTTKVTISIMGGIIIMVLFYTFGLFLIINSIAKGYKYLVSKRYLKKNFNLLLISEINFHLNKSKLVILSSIIFMMLSIGALILSQVIVDAMNISTGEEDYVVYVTYLKQELANDEGRILILEDNKEKLSNYNVDLSNNILLISEEAAEEDGIDDNKVVEFNIGEDLIEFMVYIEPKDNLINDFGDEIEAFMSIDNILKLDSFSEFNYDYYIYEYLEGQVEEGNLNSANIHKISKNDNSGEQIPLISLSEYNEYLKLMGEKEITLNDNEIWLEGYIDDDFPGYEVKGRSMNDIYGVIVNDELFNAAKSVKEEDYLYISEVEYYKAINNNVKMRIDEELEDVIGYPIIVSSEVERAIMGNNVFILLMAFYISIIFIISNIVLISINLVSHAIENKKIYVKLEEIGMNNEECSKYVSSFIRRFYLIPFIIGIISGIIVTNFAIKLLFADYLQNTGVVNYKLVIYIMLLYIIIYILFMSITKYIYNKIIND